MGIDPAKSMIHGENLLMLNQAEKESQELNSAQTRQGKDGKATGKGKDGKGKGKGDARRVEARKEEIHRKVDASSVEGSIGFPSAPRTPSRRVAVHPRQANKGDISRRR